MKFAGTLLRAWLVLLFWINAGGARADAVSDFYAGKTVTLLVPVAPGGSY